MPGLHPQSRRKREKHAVDMSPPGENGPPQPTWFRPPPEECEDSPAYPFTPEGAVAGRERILVRMVSHVPTGQLVEFAVMQQTCYRGKWRDVAAVDSCHDRDVHLHRYARSTGNRVGKPETLLEIANLRDVQRGMTSVTFDWPRALGGESSKVAPCVTWIARQLHSSSTGGW